MARRFASSALALLGLIVLSPVLCLAAIGIRLSSRGPILYKAKRVGLNGRHFTMYKFRTMHTDQTVLTSCITADKDPRIFALGALLRRLKIDELPQLINVVKGEMAFVVPRPEDPFMVDNHYTPEQLETLCVLPGLTSPGSIYYYTRAETSLDHQDPETCYVKQVLPVKLSLDLVYVREASLLYDVRVVVRTAWVILCIFAGRTSFPDPPEMRKVSALSSRLNEV
jgi:lipopolysaccharide/colanic/teichoic acid biosynthesis glycosyltransferase